MKKIICFDFDGVISKYTGWKGFDVLGEPIQEAIDVMRKLKQRGFYITIFTTRPATPAVLEWLKKYDVPYDSINSNSHNPSSTSQKPIYHCMVDDRAVRYTGQNCDKLIEQIDDVLKTDI